MNGDQGGAELNGSDLSGVRSGDLAPYEERAPIQPLADSTAISPTRAIPPEQVSAIVARYKHVDPVEAMIPVLQEMQVKFGYITQDAAEQMSVELGLPAADVYGVITFYSFFRYTPRGGHVIMSCEGTGCYVRGAGNVRGAVEHRLSVGPGETSPDGVFTFEPQSICLGACDLGPLVEIEGTYYSHVTPEKMDAIITQWYEAGDDKPVGDNLTGGHRPAWEESHGFGPTADELYADFDVARFTPIGVSSEVSDKTPSAGVEQATESMPPTPNQGHATGSKSQA